MLNNENVSNICNDKIEEIFSNNEKQEKYFQ